jgi:EAL and modified HD-GYP domain-containing signal transduction protein
VEAHYLARQPIFDRSDVVVGYELLYRSGDGHNRARVVDDVDATMDVIYRSVVELGLDTAVSAVPAWLNVTPELLRRQAHLVFTPGCVVLEVLESVMPDSDVLALLDEVAAQGYTIALDDFVVGRGRDELVSHADVVKLELPLIGIEDLAAQVAAVHRAGAVALVEKIETHEQHAGARAAGADLFQGYFFTKPQILATRSASPSTPALLALLAKVNDPEVDLDELARLVATDVALATKVIKSANSGFAGLRHRVDSVRQAVVLIGLQRMRQLVTLLVLGRATDKPAELFRQALVRAEMAAGLVDLGSEGARGPADRERAFTAGLLSTVDAFTDLPLPDVVQRLGLGDELRHALIDREGTLGRVLATTLAYEDDDVAGHDPASISDVYTAAVRRSEERWGELALS